MSAGVAYTAPLRCGSCQTPIQKKPKAKTPKFCPACREKQQNAFKQKVKQTRQNRFRR